MKQESNPSNPSVAYCVGKRLRKARRMADLTQAEVEEKTGFATFTLSAWENGKGNPPLAKLETLAFLYDVPMEFFFDGAPKPKPRYGQVAEVADVA